jgi:hypothetical protein
MEALTETEVFWSLVHTHTYIYIYIYIYIKSLNETCSEVRTGSYLSDPISFSELSKTDIYFSVILFRDVFNLVHFPV